MAQNETERQCIYCGKTHPASTKFCPTTGKDLYTTCGNPDCKNHNKKVLPVGVGFCPECGTRVGRTIPIKETPTGRSSQRCPYCGGTHPANQKFCTTSGKRLLILCPNENCINNQREVIRIGTRFCPECGTRIPGSRIQGRRANGNNTWKWVIAIIIAFMLIAMLSHC